MPTKSQAEIIDAATIVVSLIHDEFTPIPCESFDEDNFHGQTNPKYNGLHIYGGSERHIKTVDLITKTLLQATEVYVSGIDNDSTTIEGGHLLYLFIDKRDHPYTTMIELDGKHAGTYIAPSENAKHCCHWLKPDVSPYVAKRILNSLSILADSLM